MDRIEDIQERFFAELTGLGVDRFDLGVRKDGKFRQAGLSGLIFGDVTKRLGCLGAEKKKGADVYFRPAAAESWPIVFVDDLTTGQARALAGKYQCWIVETSVKRHHAWILTSGKPLLVWQRYAVQKMIVSTGWGDPGRKSGDHFGRVPGFKNWKRGEWVNLKESPNQDLMRLSPWGGVLHPGTPEAAGTRPAKFAGGERRMGRGESMKMQTESEKEFGWTCGWLRSGGDPEEAVRRLTLRAAERGKWGKSPEGYARLTVENAQRIYQKVPNCY